MTADAELDRLLSETEALRDFTDREKLLIGNSQPMGTALASAIGTFREALRAGGYGNEDAALAALAPEIAALAVGLWIGAKPSLLPLLTATRARAAARAEELAAEIRGGQWKAARSALGAGAAPSRADALRARSPLHAEKPSLNPTSMNTSPASRPIITSESILAAMNAFSAEKDPRKRAAIYAKDISPRLAESDDMPLTAANAPGTLAGTLITQRTLELLKFQFPILKSIATDFSAEGGLFNQTVKSRLVGIPTAGTYSTSTGYAQTDVTSTDVDVTLSAHKYVQLSFSANDLSGTARKLLEEYAPACSYALAKDLVDALYALITAANFTSTATTVALVDFVRNDLIDIATALTLRGVPGGSMNRTALLHPTYFGKLSKDSGATLNVVTALAAFQRPEIVTEGILPELEGFKVISSPNLPGNSENLTGFAMSRSALLAVTRTPADYAASIPGASHGLVAQVIDPDLGIAVTQTQYVDHTLGRANQRIALMWGVAKGQSAAGQRIVSA